MNIKEKFNEVKEYVDTNVKYIANTVKPETLVKVTGASLLATAVFNAKAQKAKREYKKLNDEYEEVLDSRLCLSTRAMREDLPKITGDYAYTDFTMRDALGGDYIIKLVNDEKEIKVIEK